ncbi:MAG TPA: hypothetical protein DCE58_00090, partial [Cryomorphaceae bacterium]|nr:hypothetical protein [Cryomorphaceae bacterium]
MKTLSQEAHWAVNTWLASGQKTEEDTAVLFHSWNAQKRYLDHLAQAFDQPHALHAVAIKTQPHPAILKKVVEWGFGLEAASMEEVQLALQVGCSPERIVFDSPVKTRAEIAYCQAHLPGLRFNGN